MKPKKITIHGHVTDYRMGIDPPNIQVQLPNWIYAGDDRWIPIEDNGHFTLSCPNNALQEYGLIYRGRRHSVVTEAGSEVSLIIEPDGYTITGGETASQARTVIQGLYSEATMRLIDHLHATEEVEEFLATHLRLTEHIDKYLSKLERSGKLTVNPLSAFFREEHRYSYPEQFILSKSFSWRETPERFKALRDAFLAYGLSPELPNGNRHSNGRLDYTSAWYFSYRQPLQQAGQPYARIEDEVLTGYARERVRATLLGWDIAKSDASEEKFERARQFIAETPHPMLAYGLENILNVVTDTSPVILSRGQLLKTDDDVLGDIIDRFAGRPILVDVWSTTCGPCLYELSNVFPKLLEEYADRVAFVFLCLNSPHGAWKKRIESLDFEAYHLLLDNDRAARVSTTLKVSGIPHHAIFDREGNLIYSGSGAIQAQLAALFPGK